MIEKFKINQRSVNTKYYSIQIDFHKENIEYFDEKVFKKEDKHSYGT